MFSKNSVPLCLRGKNPLAAVVQVVVPHQDGLVLFPDPGLQHLADEEGVVAVGHLAHYLALPPGRGVQQQGAAGFRAVLEGLAADDVALPLVGLEEVEGGG